jgi:AcrR family transcriptional regulator
LNILEKTKARYREYEDRHQQIMQAAIRLFNEKGYHATTTASIAIEAGVHEPTLYQHFTKKSVLYIACLKSIVDQLSVKYRKIYNKNQDDVIAYISGVTKMYLDFVEQNPHKSMFLIHMLSSRNDPLFYQIFEDFMEKNIKAVEKVLTSAVKKGKIRLKSTNQHEIRLLASLFVCQYFAAVAVRDFTKSESLKSETFINSMIGMLQILDR